MVASNILKGDEAVCHSEELLLGASDQIVLDVRNPPELEASGSFPDAVNIPLDQLRQRLHELPKDKEILVACQVGLRGHVACRMLIQYGFKARNLTGGFKTYQMVTTKF
jgi:rhodanese-related sulfurtransferase